MKAVVKIGPWAVAAVLGAAPFASAQEAAPRVALRWNAPDECPDDAALLAAVQGFLGEPLSAANEQHLSVTLSVTGAAGAFAAKMRFKSKSGVEERFLEHPECSKLMEACALLAALAINPERVKARQAQAQERVEPAQPAPAPAEPSPNREPAPVVHGEEPRQDEPSSAAAPTPRARVGAAVRAGLDLVGFASAGTLPTVAPGAWSPARVSAGPFQAGRRRVATGFRAPRPCPESENGSIELGLWTLGARACALPRLGDWSLHGCLGADVGDMTGTGQGLENGHTSRGVFSALTAGVGLRYGVGRLSPVAGIEGGWAVSRPAFGVAVEQNATEIFRSDSWNISAFVGLSYLL